MQSINKVFLIGNVTRDPEVKKTLSGETITTFGLATNRQWQTLRGRKEQSTEFHEVVCFGSLAQQAEKLVKKGRFLNVEGHLKTRSWDDSEGLKKYRTEIVATSIILLEKRQKTEEEETRGEFSESAQPSIEIENPSVI